MASKSPQDTDEANENGSGSKSKSTKKMTPKEQSAQFIKTARELECDESGDKFKVIMKSLKQSTTP